MECFIIDEFYNINTVILNVIEVKLLKTIYNEKSAI